MQPSERITFASVPEIQTTCDSHDTKGLSITTHLDSSVLWRPSLHAVPLRMSGRKYLHFLIRLDIQTSRRFYLRVTHKQRQRANFYCHLIPWNRLELCTTVSIKPLIKNRRAFSRFMCCQLSQLASSCNSPRQILVPFNICRFTLASFLMGAHKWTNM